jgi:hypothetical protein
MATIATGYTFADGQTATPVRLNALSGSATITFSTAADTDDASLEVSGNKFRVKDGGITAAKVAAGYVVRVLQAKNGNYTSYIAEIPVDGTVPLITEGADIVTQVIAPSSASNKVLVVADGWITTSAALNFTAAVFRGTTCIQAVLLSSYAANASVPFSIAALDEPATLAGTSYSVRIGVPTGSGAGLYINGTTTTFLYGGTAGVTLTLYEVKG